MRYFTFKVKMYELSTQKIFNQNEFHYSVLKSSRNQLQEYVIKK